MGNLTGQGIVYSLFIAQLAANITGKTFGWLWPREQKKGNQVKKKRHCERC